MILIALVLAQMPPPPSSDAASDMIGNTARAAPVRLALAPQLAERQGDPHAIPPGWEYVVTSRAGSVFYAHRPSLRRRGDGVRVWVRVDHTRDQTVTARTSRDLLVIQCEARTYHSEDLAQFDANGLEIEHTGRSSESNIPPDSAIENLRQFACDQS